MSVLLLIIIAALIVHTDTFMCGSRLKSYNTLSQVHNAKRLFYSSRSGAGGMTMMPIGIPKVAYKMPGGRGGEWVDIYNRLNRERIVFLTNEIDDELANQIIGVLLVRRHIISYFSYET